MSSQIAPVVRRRADFSAYGARVTIIEAGAVIFGLLAVVFLAWPLYRLSSPLEFNRNEPWNAWFIDAAVRGTGLYPGASELTVNNYPPLSFYIVGLVSELTGDTIYAGRLVALMSAGALALAVALCVQALGGRRITAVFGGLWCLATLAYFFSRYAGVNDPNLLALAAMGLALALFLSRVSKGRPAGTAIACMVLAGFIKHSLIAIPLAAGVWLLLKDWRQGVRAILLGALLTALGLGLCRYFYGANFFAEMLMPREISVSHIWKNAGKIQYIAPALLVWAYWAWTNRGREAAQFTALLMGTSLFSDVLQAAGAGVALNSHLEAVFAAGIGLALAFEGIAGTSLAKRSGATALQAAVLAVLVLRLVLGENLEPYLLLTSPAFRQDVRLKEAAMEAEVSRIKAIPGVVACKPLMTACYRAGKPFVYDEFWVDQMIATGKLTEIALTRSIHNHGIHFEQIDEKAVLGKRRAF